MTTKERKGVKPSDGTIHQCELLEYHGRYLEYAVPRTGGGHNRWRFIVPKETTGAEDIVYLDYVLYCPGCGEDLRKDTGRGLPGAPQLQELLEKLKED